MPATKSDQFWYVLLLATAVALMPATAVAQTTEKRFEIGGGLRLASGLVFDSVDANEIAFGGARRPLFSSSSEIDAAPGAEARVAYRLTPALQIESSLAFTRTDLVTSITADREASNVTLSEPLTQYLLQVGVVRTLAHWRDGRAAPFVSGGLGVLRQVHDGRTLVDDGAAYYVGGGIDIRFGSGGSSASRLAGVRADLRESLVSKSLTIDDEMHAVPVLGVTMFFRF